MYNNLINICHRWWCGFVEEWPCLQNYLRISVKKSWNECLTLLLTWHMECPSKQAGLSLLSLTGIENPTRIHFLINFVLLESLWSKRLQPSLLSASERLYPKLVSSKENAKICLFSYIFVQKLVFVLTSADSSFNSRNLLSPFIHFKKGTAAAK